MLINRGLLIGPPLKTPMIIVGRVACSNSTAQWLAGRAPLPQGIRLRRKGVYIHIYIYIYTH